MARLRRLSSAQHAVPALNFIFIHGLGGDPYTTWALAPSNPQGWQQWLMDDLPEANLWTLEYDVSPTAWLGRSMPLVDRATNVLATLDAQLPDDIPLFFVTHSLGGLLTKQLLKQALSSTPEYRSVAAKVKGIIFLATPHAGSSAATIVAYLKFFTRKTAAITDLQAHAPALRELNLWFRNNFVTLGIEVAILFETRPTYGVTVVDPTSADPGIPGFSPIPVDADHLSICKPTTREDLVYAKTVQVARRVLQRERSPRVSAAVSGSERRAVAGLLTFLEDRRLLTDDTGFQSHYPDNLRASAEAIRNKANAALEEIDRESPLVPPLKKIREAALRFQTASEGAMNGERAGGGVTPLLPMGLKPYLRAFFDYRDQMLDGMKEAAVLCGLSVDPGLLQAFEDGQLVLHSLLD